MKKRLFSILLVLTLILSILPMPLAAAADSDVDVAEENAFDALGIDTDILPEGYDENSTDNPYGRGEVALKPVYELYEQQIATKEETTRLSEEPCKEEGHSDCTITTDKITKTKSFQTTLYGHNAKISDDYAAFQNSAKHREAIDLWSANSTRTTHTNPPSVVDSSEQVTLDKPRLVSTVAVGGHFSKAEDAAPMGEVVTIGVDAFAHNAGLYMYFADGAGTDQTSVGERKTLIAPSEASNTVGTIGNYNGSTDLDHFKESNYFMQSYLKAAAGDFDNDGTDEVAVYVPARGSSRIEVYKLHVEDNAPDNAYLDPASWKLEWSYYLKEGNYVSNMVSLTAGDFDRDGSDDLAITWGYYFAPDNNNGCRAVVLSGSREGKMLQSSREIDLSYEGSQIVRAAFTFGDIDGDDVDDLILGGSLASDLASGYINSRFCAVYTYNGDDDQFVQAYATNFHVSTWHMGNFAGYYSLPVLVANLTTFQTDQLDGASIYLDSLVIDLEDQGLSLNAALGDKSGGSVMEDESYVADNKYVPTHESDHNYGYYVEYGAMGGNFTGKGEGRLRVMQYILPVIIDKAEDGRNSVHSASSQWVDSLTEWLGQHNQFVKEHAVDLGNGQRGLVGKFNLIDASYTKTGSENSTYWKSRSTQVSEIDDPSYSYCKVNTDNDTTLLKYGNEHYMVYSDPKILAVLASPPYFKDLSTETYGATYMQSTTGYEESKGTGQSSYHTNTFTLGGYFACGYEGLTTKFETELGYQHGLTWESSTATETEYSVGYSTLAGQDSVTLYSVPTAIYYYTSYIPIIEEDGTVSGYDEQRISINIPYSPMVATMALDKYESIASDFPELPKISGSVLTHTLGEPSTYPTERDLGKYGNVLFDGEADYRGVGFGYASQSMSIEKSSEKEKGFTHTDTIEFRAGGGSLFVWGGVTTTFENNRGKATITTSGSEYSAELYNMPPEAEQYGYNMVWKLFAYLYANGDGSNSFPVVSYVVKDVTAPPRLPDDFGTDVGQTTPNQIALTWDYKGSATGFQLYRYYDFPVGGGSYELYFAGSDCLLGTDPDGTRHYRYIDKGLNPYTPYKYQIQTIGSSVPPESIISEIYTFRTKTDTGYPDIKIVSAPDNTSPVSVFPDEKTTIQAVVTQEDGSAFPEAPRYQWQKQTSGAWSDLMGKTSDTLTFSAAGQSSEGVYRCLVNVISENPNSGLAEYISAYSEQVTVDYSKRTARLVSFTAADADKNGKPEIAIALASAHQNHNAIPTGGVTITLSSPTFSATYSATLKDGEASPEATDDLPDGVYEITAYYPTTRVFKALEAGPIYFYKGDGTGYVLSANQTELTYGDSLTPQFDQLSQQADGSFQLVSAEETDVRYDVLHVQRVFVRSAGDTELNIVTYSRWEDVTYETVEGTAGTKVYDAGTKVITPYRAGLYRVKALIGNDVVSSLDFVVNTRPVTVGMEPNPMMGHYPNEDPGNPVPGVDNLVVDEATPTAFGQELAEHLDVNVMNSAGTTIDKTDLAAKALPGSYTMTPYVSIDRLLAPEDPHGVVEYYDITDNYDFTFTPAEYIVTGTQYQVTLAAAKIDDATVGRVKLTAPEETETGGSYTQGTQLVARALPDDGYEVDHWEITKTDDGALVATFDPDENSNYQTSIQHPLAANNTTITAYFRKTVQTLRYEASPANAGSVIAVDENGEAIDWMPSGVTINANSTAYLKALPNPGYTFMRWERVDGGTQTTQYDGTGNADGSNMQEMTFGEKSVRVYAQFARDPYVLTLGEDLHGTYWYDENGQTGDGPNKDGNEAQKTVYSGEQVPGGTEVTIAPDPGFSLDAEAEWSITGTVLSDQNRSEPGRNATIILLSDTEVSVGTVNEPYTITLTSSGHGVGESELSAQVNGQETEDLTDLPGGSEVVVTASPAHGFVFDHWKIGGEALEDPTGKNPILTIPKLASALEIEAVFDDNTACDITVAFLADMGAVTYSLNGGEDIEIEPDDTLPDVFEGDAVVLTAVPNEKTRVRKWTVDGIDTEQLISNTWTFDEVRADHEVEVIFGGLVAYTLNLSAGDGGSAGAEKKILGGSWETVLSGELIDSGSRVRLTATPNDDYMVSGWTLNGEEITTADGLARLDETIVFDSFGSSEDPAEVHVDFAALVAHTFTVTGAEGTENDTYTYETEKGAEIETLADDQIRDGASITFVITPASDYQISAVTVTGNAGDDQGFDSVTVDEATGVWRCTVDAAGDDLDVTVATDYVYTIDVTASSGGQIIASAQKAIPGTWVMLQVIPAAGYQYNGITVNQDSIDLDLYAEKDAEAPLTAPVTNTVVWFEMPAGDVRAAASYSVAYAITATASAGGRITPANTTYVGEGRSQTYTIKADSEYKLLQVTVDGVEQGPITSYTFENVVGPHTISATFKETSGGGGGGSGGGGGGSGGGGGGGGSSGAVSATKFTLTFATNGGSAIRAVTDEKNVTVDLESYKSTREGFIFAGWYSDSALTKEVASVKLTKDATVYAKWTEVIENPFLDVSDSAYYHDAVQWAYKNDITGGTSATAFSPSETCTRAQTVTFLWRAMGSPEPTTAVNPFTDVAADAYYYKAVLWAVEKGITKGTSDTTFSPNATVTRGQTVTLLYRAAGSPYVAESASFTDVAADAYYAEAVVWAVSNRITNGTGDHRFSPSDPCTRAQIVTFLYRYMGK